MSAVIYVCLMETAMNFPLRLASYCLLVSACTQSATVPDLKSVTDVSPQTAAEPARDSAEHPVNPSPTPKPRYVTVSEGVFLGAAIKRVYPTCPPQVRCAGKVKVRIAIEPAEGIVLEATGLNVHPLLRQPVEEAAKQWRFKPTMDPPPNLRVAGVLTFNLNENTPNK